MSDTFVDPTALSNVVPDAEPVEKRDTKRDTGDPLLNVVQPERSEDYVERVMREQEEKDERKRKREGE